MHALIHYTVRCLGYKMDYIILLLKADLMVLNNVVSDEVYYM
jgi:hypothetical protein